MGRLKITNNRGKTVYANYEESFDTITENRLSGNLTGPTTSHTIDRRPIHVEKEIDNMNFEELAEHLFYNSITYHGHKDKHYLLYQDKEIEIKAEEYHKYTLEELKEKYFKSPH